MIKSICDCCLEEIPHYDMGDDGKPIGYIEVKLVGFAPRRYDICSKCQTRVIQALENLRNK